ncbi:MAG: FtsW/RodA/SpoVE family cell cycle protein [Eubacteriales bacterium]|nr:FtsW/RodA/SpoVE family cell cycle protein [Eubacteriales bacterium]
MINLVIQISKYAILFMMAIYTLQSYLVFSKKDDDDKDFIFLRQDLMIFMIHFIAYLDIYLRQGDTMLYFLYGAQFIYLAAVLVFFHNLYPRGSKLVLNHMCMLIMIGFVMMTRLSYDIDRIDPVKHFEITVAATIVAMIIPLIVRRMRILTRWTWLYAAAGIGALGLVAVAAKQTYGAKLGFTIAGISIQPSEFVKIIFVFCIAGMLGKAKNFKDIVITTALAAMHVLILVASRDLGSALIFFMTYLIMLYVSTRKSLYLLAGLLAGAAAGVGAYFLFSHVQQRVDIWMDPFADYSGSGYQVAQSLFAIAAGGWFGTGVFQGSPDLIPIVEQDFMFAAITEEFGGIFSICFILVCMSCYIMFVNIAMRLSNRFYRLVALGLGTMYAVQVFLTIGGALKFIPMTGVTIPLVSHGGSSMLSTQMMFAIIQGLYILREDEEDQIERYRERERQMERQRYYGS